MPPRLYPFSDFFPEEDVKKTDKNVDLCEIRSREAGEEN